MLCRNESVWFAIRGVGLDHRGQVRYLSLATGDYATCEEACRVARGRFGGVVYLVAWNWLAGASVIECHTGDKALDADTLTNAMMEDENGSLATCIWDELVGWQRRHDIITLCPVDADQAGAE